MNAVTLNCPGGEVRVSVVKLSDLARALGLAQAMAGGVRAHLDGYEIRLEGVAEGMEEVVAILESIVNGKADHARVEPPSPREGALFRALQQSEASRIALAAESVERRRQTDEDCGRDKAVLSMQGCWRCGAKPSEVVDGVPYCTSCVQEADRG